MSDEAFSSLDATFIFQHGIQANSFYHCRKLIGAFGSNAFMLETKVLRKCSYKSKKKKKEKNLKKTVSEHLCHKLLVKNYWRHTGHDQPFEASLSCLSHSTTLTITLARLEPICYLNNNQS